MAKRKPEPDLEHMTAIGQKGGRAKTPEKQAASRANGKKGGRPRKEQSK